MAKRRSERLLPGMEPEEGAEGQELGAKGQGPGAEDAAGQREGTAELKAKPAKKPRGKKGATADAKTASDSAEEKYTFLVEVRTTAPDYAGGEILSPIGEVLPEWGVPPTEPASSGSEVGPAGDAALSQATPPAGAAEISGPVSLAGKSVWVIDAPSLIFQVFHALPPMSTPRGEPVSAVYGFANDLSRIRREFKPDFLFVAFDTDAPTFRDEMYDDYKGNRDEMPADLAQQWPLIREMIAVQRIPILELEGFEADDVLATFAEQCGQAGARCFLVTGDKDCRQLLSPLVKIVNLRKNLIYDEAMLLGDWGVRPEQVVDFQGLVGDSVDKIPGVPLIGPKTATQLLAQYGTLEGVLAAAPSMPPSKKRENLINFAEQGRLSRKLATLDRHVPIEIDWAAGRSGQPDAEAAYEFFLRMDFRRLGDEMKALIPPKPPVKWDHDYHAVATPEAFEKFFAELSQQPVISIDTETTSLSGRDAELVGLSFCWAPPQAFYIAVRTPPGEPHLETAWVLERLRPILENPQVQKVGQNLKYDMIVLRAAGVELKGLSFDTMVASYLIDAGARNHTLDELAKRYLNHVTTKISELIGTGKQQKRMDDVPLEKIAYYAAEDADVPVRIMPRLDAQLQEQALRPLFDTIEMPLVEVLAELEYNGIRVDPARLAELSGQYGLRLSQIEAEIYELAGKPFNINSPKQLQQILFDELKLPIRRRVQTGASTDADVLEDLAGLHALPAKIIEYRQFAKLKNTYVDALPTMISPKTGRVHASFHQHIAATGRLSSSDPNLQNIPIRTDEGREIRSAFLPGEPGWVLLTADYSQIELRVLAHYTGDATLCQAFQDDQDIHALVASQVHNVPLAEVTSSMRRQAKTVNFGIIYGQSPYGLARQLGIPVKEAETFIDDYFRRYPGVEAFLAQTLADARKNRYVSTLFGRRRTIEGIRATPGKQRNLGERTAINTVIQGTAADLIKQAMLSIHRRLKSSGVRSRMLLQIHDELVFETPQEELAEVAKWVAEEMTCAYDLRVPLKVDRAVGPNWLDALPYEGA